VTRRGDPDPWRGAGAPERGRGGQPGGGQPGDGQAGPRQGWGGGDRGGADRGGADRGGADRGGTRRGWDGRSAGDHGWGRPNGRGPGVRGQRGRAPGDDGRTDPGPGYASGRGQARGDDRGWASGGGAAALAGIRGNPVFRWVGTLSIRIAIYVLLGASLIGVIGTVLTGSEPGFLLSLTIIIGSVAAALGISRRGVYLLIPLPALIFFVAAVLTGAVHDSSADSSNAAYGLHFLQWIAAVFTGMCAATILVVVIFGGRWLLSRQLVSGQFPMSGDDGGRGSRAAAAPGQHADRDRRPPRDNDPWAERRQPYDRGQPSFQPGGTQPAGGQQGGRQPGATQPGAIQPGVRPPGGTQPGQRPPGTQPGRRPPGGGRPGDRPPPPDRDQWGPRDPRDAPDPRGTGTQRPGRDVRDPRDPWDNRLSAN
jgi:hypothetical protein